MIANKIENKIHDLDKKIVDSYYGKNSPNPYTLLKIDPYN